MFTLSFSALCPRTHFFFFYEIIMTDEVIKLISVIKAHKSDVKTIKSILEKYGFFDKLLQIITCDDDNYCLIPFNNEITKNESNFEELRNILDKENISFTLESKEIDLMKSKKNINSNILFTIFVIYM